MPQIGPSRTHEEYTPLGEMLGFCPRGRMLGVKLDVAVEGAATAALGSGTLVWAWSQGRGNVIIDCETFNG